MNQFDHAQVYFGVHEFSGIASYYQVNLEKRAASQDAIGNFPIVNSATTVGAVVYATKGHSSTWDRQPSQEIYRADAEWSDIQSSVAQFAVRNVPPIAWSSGSAPIVVPGGDDFQYIDIDGALITQNDRVRYDRRLRANMLQNLLTMDRRYRSRAWGILEMEAPFFELIGESPEACEIIAQPNVMLFDTRMLNTSTTVGGHRKEIHPAAKITLTDIPILALTTEPSVEVMWRRFVRYFRHLELFAGAHQVLVNYRDAGPELSPSLEHGEYKYDGVQEGKFIGNAGAILPQSSGNKPWGALRLLTILGNRTRPHR